MIKSHRSLARAFGVDEYGYPMLPPKISGTKISRLLVGEYMGCSFCFPHGQEVINSYWYKIQRSWKKHRRNQWWRTRTIDEQYDP